MERLGIKINIIFFLGLFFFIAGCGSDTATEKKNPESVEVKNQLRIPAFNADSAYQYIQDQVDMGPRVPDTEAQREAIKYFEDKFKSFDAQVKLQTVSEKRFDGVAMNGTNIIASFNPEIKKRIFICAHWDSRFMGDKDPDATKRDLPIDGADDGGSGVGVILEIARQIQSTPLINVGLDLVLFDLEDQGEDGGGDADSWGIGSQYWAINLPKGYRPEFGILLDMVGSENARFAKEGYSRQVGKKIVDKVWRLGQGMGYGNYFSNDHIGELTDDHYFIIREAKIPCIDIINTRPNNPKPFGAYHHTHADNMDVISKPTLKAVGQTTLAAIYHYHNGTF